MSVLHADAPGFHTLDAPGSGAEQEDVTRQTLDREIFIQRADYFALGLRHHGVGRGFRDRAAGSNGHQTRSTPAPHAAIHLIAMQISSVAATLRSDPIGQHGHDGVEFAALQIAIRIGAADQLIKVVFLPIPRGCFRHYLLRENVEWRSWNLKLVERA